MYGEMFSGQNSKMYARLLLHRLQVTLVLVNRWVAKTGRICGGLEKH